MLNGIGVAIYFMLDGGNGGGFGFGDGGGGGGGGGGGSNFDPNQPQIQTRDLDSVRFAHAILNSIYQH